MKWISDQGDGTYKNPIIYADYSDPDAIRVGDDFYLISSSFNCVPGVPVLHSKDLVNWKIIGHVFKEQIPATVFNTPQHDKGVWAPAIRFHNGQFYVFYPDPDFGIYVSEATEPEGPWSKPLLIKSAKGWIDPCPFWDDDGNAYLVHAWANSRAGINSIITINRMSADGTKILDDGRTVFDGHANHPTIEGPKLYRRNGYYYIFAPAGGVPTGWQTVLRSRNIYGPYEDRIVMDQGNTNINGPHQGAWVELKSGESWFIHFQDLAAYGRVTLLQPMKWVDDWPVIGKDDDGDGKGQPVTAFKKPNVGATYPVETPQTTDEFDSKETGLQWQWHANSKDEWMSLSARPGWLRLFAVLPPEGFANLWSVPNLFLQKLPAPEFTVTTRLDFTHLRVGDKTGLVMMGRDYSALLVERDDSGYRILRSVCIDADNGNVERMEATEALKTRIVQLRVAVGAGGVCCFSYSTDGDTFIPIGTQFVARAGGWIGAKVGLFALSDHKGSEGFGEYEWFRVE